MFRHQVSFLLFLSNLLFFILFFCFHFIINLVLVVTLSIGHSLLGKELPGGRLLGSMAALGVVCNLQVGVGYMLYDEDDDDYYDYHYCYCDNNYIIYI